jgi:hypothetical protein
VFLGVLRVLARHEGQAPSTPAINDELRIVQQETRTTVNLARTPDRNIIRNSGQYWKGTGLLVPESGQIHLTELGRRIATGQVTRDQFAAIMVQQTKLPNPWTYAPGEIARWRAAGLEIRPLVLILQVIEELGRYSGSSAAFITPQELIKVVIPLAGARAEVTEIAADVVRYRIGSLDLTGWPDCAPSANDHRLAREFLLFLANFGLCRRESAESNQEERYWLDQLFDVSSETALIGSSIFADPTSQLAAVEAIRHSDLPSIIERQRTATTALRRTGQDRFRREILGAYGTSCILSGETISEVLEAAHIIPFEDGGADTRDNGLCLRVDLHRLFDSGNIRLKPDGALVMSEAVGASDNYWMLPSRITIPSFVRPANVEWRDRYL